MKAEMRRAQERMSLRHRSGNKWSMAMKHKDENDEVSK